MNALERTSQAIGRGVLWTIKLPFRILLGLLLETGINAGVFVIGVLKVALFVLPFLSFGFWMILVHNVLEPYVRGHFAKSSADTIVIFLYLVTLPLIGYITIVIWTTVDKRKMKKNVQ
ncbi:MAG: hypothetical protein ABI977_24895 [Acidobacteriota bacterium]